MREPAASWLATTDEEDVPDEIEFDPRWEVQPTPDLDGDAGGGRHWILIVAVAIVVVAASFVWRMGDAPAI